MLSGALHREDTPGSPIWTPESQLRNFRNSIAFNGTDEYLQTATGGANSIPDIIGRTNSAYSLSFWFYGTPNSSPQTVLDNRNNGVGFAIGFSASNEVVCGFFSSGNAMSYRSAAFTNGVGRWFHVYMRKASGNTIATSEMRVMVNGVLSPTTVDTLSGTITASFDYVRIGANTAASTAYTACNVAAITYWPQRLPTGLGRFIYGRGRELNWRMYRPPIRPLVHCIPNASGQIVNIMGNGNTELDFTIQNNMDATNVSTSVP